MRKTGPALTTANFLPMLPKQYAGAFTRNDETRYQEYIAALVKGEAKVNASNIMPYDAVAHCGERPPIPPRNNWHRPCGMQCQTLWVTLTYCLW